MPLQKYRNTVAFIGLPLGLVSGCLSCSQGDIFHSHCTEMTRTYLEVLVVPEGGSYMLGDLFQSQEGDWLRIHVRYSRRDAEGGVVASNGFFACFYSGGVQSCTTKEGDAVKRKPERAANLCPENLLVNEGPLAQGSRSWEGKVENLPAIRTTLELETRARLLGRN